jgi:hypothetical protein
MYGIVNQPLVALRAVASEISEMASQLLFGELVEVLNKSDKWLEIRNLSDDYIGFVDKKMIRLLAETEFTVQKMLLSVRVCLPVGTIYNAKNQAIILPFGSLLWLDEDNQCFVAGEKLLYDSAQICEIASQTGIEAIRAAKMFLNAPYLWGGKSIFGVDCSGLVQLIFSHLSIQLPRDVSQQVKMGEKINSLAVAREGDLAFFENDKEKITHTGILLNNREIIHSSGWVKTEKIDEKGIISNISGEYTHKLHSIRRIIL